MLWSLTCKCPFSELMSRIRTGWVLQFVAQALELQSLKKFGFKMEFWIISLLEYLMQSVSANVLLEAEGKSSWPLSEVSISHRAAAEWNAILPSTALLCSQPLSGWHSQLEMRSMFQDKESFNHNENVILTDPRSHYINTVFKAFLIIQLTISAIPLRELKTKKLKGYWPIQFQFLK